MLVSGVQSEQIRILQAYGRLTTPRILQILEYRADALGWARDNWQGSTGPEGNLEVQQTAAEAHDLVVSHQLLDRRE